MTPQDLRLARRALGRTIVGQALGVLARSDRQTRGSTQAAGS